MAKSRPVCVSGGARGSRGAALVPLANRRVWAKPTLLPLGAKKMHFLEKSLLLGIVFYL